MVLKFTSRLHWKGNKKESHPKKDNSLFLSKILWINEIYLLNAPAISTAMEKQCANEWNAKLACAFFNECSHCWPQATVAPTIRGCIIFPNLPLVSAKETCLFCRARRRTTKLTEHLSVYGPLCRSYQLNWCRNDTGHICYSPVIVCITDELSLF